MASLDFDDVPLAGKKPAAAPGGGLSFDDVPAPASPAASGIRRPIPAQELTFGERLVSALPKGAQDWLSSPTVAGANVGRGSALHGFAMGAADPVVGAVQLAANLPGIDQALTPSQSLSGLVTDERPQNLVNRAIAEKNTEYEAGRQSLGRDGFDAARLAGNVAITAPVGLGVATPATMGGKVLSGAAMGGAFGAAQPVTDAQSGYWAAKGKQTAAGAAGGAVAQPLVGALARVVSPNATKTLDSMRQQGVDNPTVGQVLGGRWNAAEERLTSLPITGDMVARARGLTRDTFNRATLNKALEPIGEKTAKIGHEGVAEVGDKLSSAYDQLLTKVGHVKFDGQFQTDLSGLRQLATNLTPDMARKFEGVVNDRLLGRMAPNGGMLAETFKKVESEIGIAARRFSRSSDAAQQELGDALTQLQSLIRQQIGRTSPQYAQELAKINEGWAKLVRVEGAATAAKGTEGVFTPGQLLTAVRQADSSVRDRATARGEALLQDWATEAQRVLGNKYPDSGTAGRAMLAGGAGASYFVNPMIPAGLVAGGGLYTQPVQKLLTRLVAARPQSAVQAGETIRKIGPAGPALLSPLAQAFNNVSQNGN